MEEVLLRFSLMICLLQLRIRITKGASSILVCARGQISPIEGKMSIQGSKQPSRPTKKNSGSKWRSRSAKRRKKRRKRREMMKSRIEESKVKSASSIRRKERKW